MGVTAEWVGVFVLVEVLLFAGAAVSQYVSPPIRRRQPAMVWAVWHVKPAWVLWRALWGWVLRRAHAAAVRACDRHERAQAAATFPARDGVR